MAFFAELDLEYLIVQRVVEIDDSNTLDANGVANESVGAAYCVQNFGGTLWMQTKTDPGFRKNFAAIGYFYDKSRDAFCPPKPFVECAFDEQTCQWAWQAPLPYPQDGKKHLWDETAQNWVRFPV